MAKIAQYKQKIKELAKIIMFETDPEMLEGYYEDLAYYCLQIRLIELEIARLSIVLN